LIMRGKVSENNRPIVIKDARFVHSAYSPKDLPKPELPEIAFAGRSNVGKSSLINCLLLRKKLVKTSSTPGRTQSINFFLINNSFYFVDLPGYGYAKVSKAVQARWRPLVESYLKNRGTLRAVVHIIDSRHPPTPEDIQLQDWLRIHSIPVITVLTKIDKLSRNAWQKNRVQASRAIGVNPEGVFLFSATKKIGREELLAEVVRRLAE